MASQHVEPVECCQLNCALFSPDLLPSSFRDEIISFKDIIQGLPSDDVPDICSLLLELFACSSDKQLLQVAKKIVVALRQPCNFQSPATCTCIKILTGLYLRYPSRHPLKSILRSLFQNFPEEDQIYVASYLNADIGHLLSWQKCPQDENVHRHLRAVVDALLSLLENFPLGEKCLKTFAVPGLYFLSKSLQDFLKTFRFLNLPVVQCNEAMHHCLAACKAINKMLQKFSDLFTDIVHSKDEETLLLLEDITQLACQLVQEETILVDCQTNGSMVLVTLLQLWNKDDFSLLLSPLFQHVALDKANCQFPLWFKETTHSGLLLANLPVSSSLSLIFAVLALASPTELVQPTQTVPDNSIFLYAILDQLFSTIARSESSACKLLGCKCLALWTAKMGAALKADKVVKENLVLLTQERGTLSKILDYIWTAWEDHSDAVRLSARNIFQNVIGIYSEAAAAWHCESNLEFMCALTNRLLQDVSWSSKGKYGALCCLVDYLGANTVLRLEENIANSILLQVREQQLASYASELYEKLLLKHKDELLHSQSSKDIPNQLTDSVCHKGSVPQVLDGQWKEIWCEQWVEPVIDFLCTEPADSSLNVHITEYILPKLLKSSQHVLEHMLSIIGPVEKSQQNSGQELYKNLGALLTCLRRAKSLGLLHQLQKTDNDKDVLCWNRVIPFSVLTHALTHLKSQIRLDAYALLCENIKMTEPLTEEELPLLLRFVKENMNSQIPAFRQSLVSYTKKLFTRLKESSRIIKRHQKTSKENETKTAPKICTHSSYAVFLFDLMKVLLKGIFPGSPFARRTTALALISSMIEVFRVDPTQESTEDDLFPIEALTRSECHTLLECLTDTFEENKIAALKILTSPQLRKAAEILQDPEFLKELLSAAMVLSESTRPQDCSTAAYLLRLLLQQENIGPVIKNYKPTLLSNSSASFLQIPLPMPGSQKQEVKINDLLLVQQLILLLIDQLEVAKTSLVHAAATRPMYPTIHCIRYIIANLNFRQYNNLKCWQEIFSKLLSVCLEAATVVSPVIHNSSPEGNIPEGAIMGPGLDMSALVTTYDDDDDQKSWLNAIGQSKELVTLMPEYLVVCSWRSIKEISLLLGQICLLVPMEYPTPMECNLADQQPSSSTLLNLQQVLSIGEYFTTQLLESKHRGAFELAYAGFVKMCDMLWKSHNAVLHKLPGQWLEEIMVCISSEDDQSRLCATRRSAGIPFYIQAIVSSEPLSSGRPFFKQTMKKLLKLATDKSSTSSQVHALNILRSLYRDTRLAEDVAPYVADGLKVAILGFSSHLWAVTNSSTLLLSALMTRIFGVNRSKLEGNVSRKNCQTGRTFFTHHPSIYEFLLDQLSQASQDVISNPLTLNPVLYPILLILGRLYPSSLDGIDSGLKLDAFIPYIINCAGSPILKTREMAAKALKPLAGKDQLTSNLCILLSYIPSEPDGKISQNSLHGLLLQILQLVKLLPSLPFSLHATDIKNVLQEFSRRLWVLTMRNPCLITRQVAVEIAMEIVIQKWEIKEDLSSTCREILSTLLDTCNKHNEYTSMHQPGQVYYLITITKVHLWRIEQTKVLSGDQCGTDCLLNLLNSPVYEVRLEVLTWMEAILTRSHSLECDAQNGMSCFCYLSMIGQSTELLDLLVKLTGQERHPICLAKVLSVLCSPLLSHILSTSTKFDPSEIMNRVLNLLKESTREEVQESAIRFSSVLVPLVYHQGLHQRNSELFSRCCTLLQEFSATEKNAETQLACALLLQKNAVILLKDPANILNHLRLSFWQIVFNLLQEDDMDVKDTAAEIYNQLQPSHPVPVHCTVAIDCLIQELLSSSNSTGSPQVDLHLLGTLISWMSPNRHPNQETKERLFDRGEMNTYRDNVDFLQTLASHLENLLSGYNSNDSLTPLTHQMQTPNDFHSTLLSWKKYSLLQDQSFVDPNIKEQFLAISNQLVSRLAQSKPHTATNAFWDVTTHQTDVQDSFQLLLPLSYLQRFLPQTAVFLTPEEDLVNAFKAVHAQIQTVFGPSSSAADNSLSVQLLLTLEQMQQYWPVQ